MLTNSISNLFKKINLYFFENEKISLQDFIYFYGFLLFFSSVTVGVVIPALIENLK